MASVVETCAFAVLLGRRGFCSGKFRERRVIGGWDKKELVFCQKLQSSDRIEAEGQFFNTVD